MSLYAYQTSYPAEDLQNSNAYALRTTYMEIKCVESECENLTGLTFMVELKLQATGGAQKEEDKT